MSPSVHLARRTTKRGPRWQVRFRWRPSDSYARYFATFARRQDAETARGWVMGQIARGLYPRAEDYFAEPAPSRTLLDVHDAFAAARAHEVGPSAAKTYRQARVSYGALGEMEPADIRVGHVREWVGALAGAGRKAATISAYRSVLRQVLDFAELERPNPARDPRVRLPKTVQDVEDPPSHAHYLLLCEHVSPRHLAALVLAERTGGRVAELGRIRWGDVDWRSELVRVRGTKTTAAMRWVPLLPEASRTLEGLRPVEDRVADQPVLPGLTDNALRSALRVASKRAGVPLYTPQDFRKRYVSLLIMAGVPATIVRMIVGHRRIAVTIDTYSRVLMDEPIDRLRELREAAYRVPGVAPIGQATRPVGDSAVTGEPS